MEANSELAKLYMEIDAKVQRYDARKTWVKMDHKFEEDPPCISALLKQGIFELGTINMAQMRIAAYFKIKGVSISDAIGLLDDWVTNIPGKFIYEHDKQGNIDYVYLQTQNRYVCKTVYGGSHYGFSCAGIKQIPGVDEYCTQECMDIVEPEKDVALFDASKSEHRWSKINVVAEVIGRQDAVMIVPHVIKATCFGKRTEGKECGNCPLYLTDGDDVEIEIGASTNGVLDFLEPSNIPLAGKIGKAIGISKAQCQRWKYTYSEQNVVSIVIVPPMVNEFENTAKHTRLLAYYFGYDILANQPYKFTGYSHVTDKSNIVRLVFDKAVAAKDTLQDFKLTPEIHRASLVFQEGEMSVYERMDHIASTLAYNHIRIWDRNPMIISVLLTYFSVRRFKLQGKIIRGWLNTLLFGDSGQGKSEAVEVIMRHLDVGYKASAEGATRAGLLWGVDTRGEGGTTLIWGTLPRYSGRLVAIDELKELIRKGHFAELTQARSSGMVTVDTIASGKAMAETRLIMMSNPPERKTLGNYFHPVEGIADLIPDLEDIRRLDIAVGVASMEIDNAVLHTNIHDIPMMEDLYDQAVFKDHILWAWSLNPEDVVITKEVESCILETSLRMCGVYTSIIPIVEPADQRESVARVAVAIASLLYSVRDEKLIVLEKHVDAAYKFLRLVFDAPGLQYDKYSQANKELVKGGGTWDVLMHDFKYNPDWGKSWKKIAWYISQEGELNPRMIAASAGIKVQHATMLCDWLAVNKLAKAINRYTFGKTPNGINFFRTLLVELQKKTGIELPMYEGDDKEEF